MNKSKSCNLYDDFKDQTKILINFGVILPEAGFLKDDVQLFLFALQTIIDYDHPINNYKYSFLPIILFDNNTNFDDNYQSLLDMGIKHIFFINSYERFRSFFPLIGTHDVKFYFSGYIPYEPQYHEKVYI